jgi:hypothetical protein
MHIPSESLNSCVLTIRPTEPSPEPADQEADVYGVTDAGQVVDHTDSKAVAQRLQDATAGRYHYLVKVARTGPDAGHLYNRFSPNFEPGQGRYEFQKVNEAVFRAYVKYLHTSNPNDYRHAERLM